MATTDAASSLVKNYLFWISAVKNTEAAVQRFKESTEEWEDLKKIKKRIQDLKTEINRLIDIYGDDANIDMLQNDLEVTDEYYGVIVRSLNNKVHASGIGRARNIAKTQVAKVREEIINLGKSV